MKWLKRTGRRIGHRLGLMTDWEQAAQQQSRAGREEPADWYDRAYASSGSYHEPYFRSCYYFSWCVIADRILRDNACGLLEIGCGPGQFAAMLRDQGFRRYVGLDFSPTAIEMARRNAPEFEFVVGDARTSDVYDRVEHDTIVCTEVLEHIEDDLLVVSRFGAGKRCLCTVPNFPYVSHVRHFKDAEQVRDRYGPFFQSLDVRVLKGPRSETEEFFLFDGVRNTHTVR